MGFNEEPGIIPRFCEDLFAEIAKKQTQEVCSHGLCKPLIRVENSQTKLKSELWPLRKNSADGVLSGPSALARWCGERAPDAGGSSWWAETRALSAVFSASSALSPVRMEVCSDSTHCACLRPGPHAPP